MNTVRHKPFSPEFLGKIRLSPDLWKFQKFWGRCGLLYQNSGKWNSAKLEQLHSTKVTKTAPNLQKYMSTKKFASVPN